MLRSLNREGGSSNKWRKIILVVAVLRLAYRFLLKYTSRDSVDLLARGKAGVHEARLAIANYTEPSPLYGLIIYRRRKVLLKYIPEGTSRVLRGTVMADKIGPTGS